MTTRILWVDDNISEFQPYVEALTNHDMIVDIASTYEEAVESDNDCEYDVYLIDLRMLGQPHDGIDIMKAIREKHDSPIMAALSSYLYLKEYIDRIASLDPPVELMDKDFPPIMADDFESRFVDPIKRLVSEGVRNTVQRRDEAVERLKGEDPFSIELSAFMAKSIVEKDALVDVAETLASSTLAEAFREGQIWVLFCGSPNNPALMAQHLEDIPDEQTIAEMSRRQGKPAYSFWAPSDVDDMWSRCSASSMLQDYPTLRFEFASQEIDVHFDTGAHMTFFSYEELLSQGAIPPTTHWGKAKRAGRGYRAIPLDKGLILKSQDGKNSRNVQVRGQVVRDWDEAPYARFCDDDCPHDHIDPGTDRPRLAPHRLALVGRNILSDNGLKLLLDGESRQTSF